jgi:hypothetical protein
MLLTVLSGLLVTAGIGARASVPPTFLDPEVALAQIPLAGPQEAHGKPDDAARPPVHPPPRRPPGAPGVPHKTVYQYLSDNSK